MRRFESIGYFTTQSHRRAYLVKTNGLPVPKVGELVVIDGKEKKVTGLDDSLSTESCYTRADNTCGIEVDESVVGLTK